MQGEIRKSGLAVIGNIPWGTHFCQFYQTKQDLIDTLVPYFKAGLENNEFCMWVTADNLTVEDARKAMTKVVKNFPTYLKKGQIEILPYDEWYLKGGHFNSQIVLNGWVKKLNQALKRGYTGLRLTGNTFWLEKKDWHSFTDYEEAVNNVIGKYKMIALCTYCLEKCNAAEIVDVIRNHEFALIKQEGKWELFENSRYKTAKEDLIESEKRFRLALKNAPVTVAAQDRNLHFLWAYNQRTVRPEDVLGKTDFDIFSKPDARRLSSLKNKVMETGEALTKKMWVTSNHKKVYLEIYLEPIKNETGKITGVEVATMDLTREKLMEDALKESEDRYHKLFENMSEGLALCEMLFAKNGKATDYRFLNINRVFEKFIGLSREQIIGKTIQEILPNVQPKTIETFGKVVSSGKPVHFENYSRDLNKWFDVYAYHARPGQFAYMVIDISERKQAEAALQESEERFKAIASNTPDHIIVQDNELHYTFVVNPQLGLTEKDMIGKTDYDILMKADADKLTEIKRQVIKREKPVHLETSAANKKGEMDYFRGSYVPKYNNKQGVDGLIGYFENITAQKKTENALKDSEERFRALSEASPVIISVTRVSDGIVLYVNKSYSASLGYKQEDLIGKPALDLYFDPAERKALIDKLNAQGFLQNYEVRVKKADGTPFWVSSFVRFITFGGERAVMGASLDITERKKTENNINRLNRELQAIRQCDQAIVHSGDEMTLFTDVCRILCTTAGYSLAWIGSVEYDEVKSIRPLVWHGDGNYLASANITWADTERGRGPTGLAVRTGKSHFFQDFITEPEAKPWRKAALSRGYRASIAIPLKDNDSSVFAVLSLYSPEPNSFNPDEIRLLEELARDISFGVIALRDKVKRRQAELELAHLASFPELNPNPIVELEANRKIVYVNHAAKDIFPDLTTNSLKHPFLVGWENLIKTIKNQDDQSITREINVGQHWYLQNVIYVPTTDHYHIYGRNITERKKIEFSLLKNEKRFRLLNEINALLLTSEQPEKIIRIVADKVMGYLNCDAFFNFIVDESNGRLKLNAYAGIPPEAAAEIEWLDFGAAICGCVARDNQPIVSVNVQENGDERAALVRSYGIKAYASYPLHIGKKITGTVSFGTRSHTNFTYDELSLIEIVADQISVAMRRKQTETALKASEERFSNAFHSSPVALSISRISDGTFIDVNRSFLHLFGYRREEIIGKKATEIVIYDNPDDRSEIVRMLQEQGKIVNYEVTARTKTGNEIKALTSAEKIDIDGQVHIIWTTIDITEREQAESLLRETSNYLNNLLDYANAPIIVWDTHFRISRFNPAFERLTGYRSQQVIGLGLDILFPDDKKEESLQLIHRTLSGERWEVAEIPILRVDGELRTVLWNSANVYDNDGKNIIATIAQGQDITERKLAEQKLRETSEYLNNLLNYANAPIIVWDSQFHITRFNHAFERLTGIGAKEAIGKQLDILFPADSKAESMNYINRTTSGEHWEVVEIPILREDGTIRVVLWNSATLMDTDGKKMVATIAQGQDITERKKAEEAVHKLNDELKQHSIELEATNKELEAFSYSVSHDLRAPLRSMEGFSQALLEDCQDILNDECKDYLKRIQSSAELMAQLIDDLLRLSRFTRVDIMLNDVKLE